MSRSRQYTRRELESLRRADLQNLYKIHGLKGANQKSDALIDTLVVHFSSPSFLNVAESAGESSTRRSKPIEIQPSRLKDVAVAAAVPKRPATSASTSRPTKIPSRPSSRLAKIPDPELSMSLNTSGSMQEWEDRLKRIEESWMERLKRAEAVFEERLRIVEEKWEARWATLQPSTIHPSPPASTPRVVVIDPSPLKRPHREPTSPESAMNDGPSSKRARMDRESSASETPPDHELAEAVADPTLQTPSNHQPDPRTPTLSHQGVLDDMSRTPGVGEVTGLPYPVFATTPRPAEPRSPTLDAPPSASRQRAWSSSALPKMLTPGRKRAEPAPRAVSQAHMDLTTITESDEIPMLRRGQTPPILFPPPRSRDRTITPPRLSPSPSITEKGFQHPSYPSRMSNLGPGGPRPRQTSTPAREYMDVALHGLTNPADSPSAQATPSHRTILGTERYRDTRFGDIPVMAWGGSPSVDYGSGTPQA